MSDLKRDAPDVLGRREFTLQSALALLAGVVITVEGCGGSTSAPSPTASPAPSPAPAAAVDVNGAISANHGHVAVVTSAQITAANALSLNIQGSATHPHSVDLTQTELASLRSRQTVTKDSTNVNNHIHTVTFTPA
jgi:hypothetical protein